MLKYIGCPPRKFGTITVVTQTIAFHRHACTRVPIRDGFFLVVLNLVGQRQDKTEAPALESIIFGEETGHRGPFKAIKPQKPTYAFPTTSNLIVGVGGRECLVVLSVQACSIVLNDNLNVGLLASGNNVYDHPSAVGNIGSKSVLCAVD
ncbi:hypothetical protein [Sinorhizobium medicae]|uniref:hypothetical protein n=1 Tax=Sinorhizobium medicae TaxID=110321 RepID=UPI000FD77B68|nr:hypothetical protein [Sinorhizobium medicae]RVJ68380.1 hypothetical protein CN168_32385 [Sinorhizobium medicae]